MLTGPPPKFHGTRDILQIRRRRLCPTDHRDARRVLRAMRTEPSSIPAKPAQPWSTRIRRGDGRRGMAPRLLARLPVVNYLVVQWNTDDH